jgi:hypothetical protein
MGASARDCARFTNNLHSIRSIAAMSYEEYLADFDPTPLYGGDDWLTPLSEEDWEEEQLEELCSPLKSATDP